MKKVLGFLILAHIILYLNFRYNKTQEVDLKKAETLIVLGNSPNPNNRPNKLLQSRLDKAIELYKKGYANTIIVTGSKVRDKYYEADVMKDYCISKNVPSKAVLREREARNTIENGKYSTKLMLENNIKSAIVVTSKTHLKRSALIFSQYDDFNFQFQASEDENFLMYLTSFPIYFVEQLAIYKTKKDLNIK